MKIAGRLRPDDFHLGKKCTRWKKETFEASPFSLEADLILSVKIPSLANLIPGPGESLSLFGQNVLGSRVEFQFYFPAQSGPAIQVVGVLG